MDKYFKGIILLKMKFHFNVTMLDLFCSCSSFVLHTRVSLMGRFVQITRPRRVFVVTIRNIVCFKLKLYKTLTWLKYFDFLKCLSGTGSVYNYN